MGTINHLQPLVLFPEKPFLTPKDIRLTNLLTRTPFYVQTSNDHEKNEFTKTSSQESQFNLWSEKIFEKSVIHAKFVSVI